MNFFWPKNGDGKISGNQDEVGTSFQTKWQETIEEVVAMNPLKPFHPEVLLFLDSISKTIFGDRSYRRFPELIALAYWLRKAHLVEMQELFNNQTNSKIVLARGVALHFAPSNVDTIFVYSWVLSMLAGNNNIIRISGQKQVQTELLLHAIMIGLEKYQEVANRTVILTYDHDIETSKYLSERCDVRIIWGGDNTVKAIRAIPLAPLAIELTFPDRFSLSVIEANTILKAGEEDFADFIHRFYNDGFWFAQMACSSPRLIVWIGNDQAIKAAGELFWNGIDNYLNTHFIDYSPALQVQKLATGYLLSGSDNVQYFSHQKNFSRIKVDSIDLEIRGKHCGGGLFIELSLQKLNDLIPYLDDKDQTLSYYGFKRTELVDFAKKLQNRGIDRIVPIGQALNFEGIWDGYDLLFYLTREIVIR
ncbi:acyl-CoA reductase [Calidifontibacillus oryziterrae]|uniref:acyl-CoA reductase n=1 Tax=Calidifontibacillus oryziterrae TaxID=1191699 RepID=UPI000318AB93|nr:acyl-CoA reductase [Calidifontibacillus oryziterrae]